MLLSSPKGGQPNAQHKETLKMDKRHESTGLNDIEEEAEEENRPSTQRTILLHSNHRNLIPYNYD